MTCKEGVAPVHRRAKALSTGLCLAAACLMVSIGYQASAGPKKVKKETRTEYTPDSQGKLNPDSTQIIKLYDLLANVIEEIERSVWPQMNKVVTYSKRNLYNERGLRDSTVTTIDGKPGMRIVPRYDSLGREMTAQEINADGTLGFSSRNIYSDSAHDPSRMELYDPKGKLYNVREYRYDRRGNPVKETGSEKDKPVYQWLYKYDRKNRLIWRDDYSGKGALLQKHRYAYNNDNQISTETVLNTQGRIERVIKYNYEYY